MAILANPCSISGSLAQTEDLMDIHLRKRGCKKFAGTLLSHTVVLGTAWFGFE
jgi:hypothetical protein